MGNLSLGQQIDAPQAVVFDLITDLANAAERIEGIEQVELLTEGAMQVGTRWRETRVMMGQKSTEELKVTWFEPGVGYSAECESCGCHYQSTFRCAESGAGTLVTLSLTWRPITLLAKLTSPLGALMARGVKKCIAQDLIDLKRAAESSSA